MKDLRPIQAVLSGILCALMLSSCKEAEQVQADHAAAMEKLAALRAEYDGLEQKLVDLRKAVPPSSSPMDSAQRMTLSLQRELDILDQQIVTVTRDYEEAQAALDKLRAETEEVKKHLQN